jgi:hypothetical protein
LIADQVGKMEDGRWSRRGGRGDDRKGRTEDLVRKAKAAILASSTLRHNDSLFLPQLPLPSASKSGAGVAQDDKRGGDPQCTRGFELCGDAAIRPHRVGEADARVLLVVPMPMPCRRATSRRPRARCISKAGAALSRAHLIIPANFPSIPPAVCANPVSTFLLQ